MKNRLCDYADRFNEHLMSPLIMQLDLDMPPTVLRDIITMKLELMAGFASLCGLAMR